jgi:hypothetical protein
VSRAGKFGQMNSRWAAWAGEAVGRDCGESAGHMDVLLASADPFPTKRTRTAKGCIFLDLARLKVNKTINSENRYKKYI